MRSALALAAVFVLSACGSKDPTLPPAFPDATTLPDLGLTTDGGELDANAADAAADAGITDDGVAADTGAPEAGPGDTGPADMAAPTDTGPVDAPGDTGTGDATPVDTGAPDAAPTDTGVDAGAPDTGVDAGDPFADADGDGISDIDEGDGLIDTDNDGTPDSADADSDNDGIPDSVEAGDTNPMTPPIDTDNDNIPDFRDDDADGDGIDDIVEGVADPDGDMVPNYLDSDSDGDFITDLQEGLLDPDNDTIPAYLDDDSDGDGIPDSVEAGDQNLASPALDSDFDTTPNFLDADSDNDNISDLDEGQLDSDGDNILDYIDIDSDNDSILDLFESGDTDLNTPAADTDNNGTPDYRDPDSDGDTILDATEGRIDTDGNLIEDRLQLDSDGDGVSDAIEAGDADPFSPPVDTDNDGLPDYRDLDSDADGLADSTEPGCPAGSERTAADSDNDGFDDLAEVAFGSDPCSGASVITDFYFVLPPGGPGANAPLTFANTGIDRADFAINVDTTGSMGGEIANLRNSLSTTIIPQVDVVIPDAAFGVSSFEDFPIAPFGSAAAGDIPFTLGTRVTTDSAVAQTAVNGLATSNGVDFPESGMEALYQIATGAGVTWTGGSVPAFNPATNNVPNVADGSIGGVGFRDDALPVVVHVTDAIAHTAVDYAQSASTINAATTAQTQTALSSIGARVVTISSGLEPFNDLLCSGSITAFFGGITPAGADVDWYEISGAVAGDTVSALARAQTFVSPLDVNLAIANAAGLIQSVDDTGGGLGTDAQLANVTLTGTGPFYVAVGASGDTNFNGAGGTTTGHYILTVDLNGAAIMPSPTECRIDEADSRVGATGMIANPVPAANQATCLANCEAILGPFSPLFQDFTFPSEMSEDTQAVIPPCAWDEFGASRPAGCGANECCTGINGVGVPANASGACPLAFEIDASGAGIDTAMVAGIEALVGFSNFTITSVVRGDPVELANSGLDTACFIHGVVPVGATPPNTCAPTPTAVDLVPPMPELDSWQNVVPGTVLDFQVNALNVEVGTANPCAPSLVAPQQFTAFIDLVADGVTVVDTRQVIIIVPPLPPGGSN